MPEIKQFPKTRVASIVQTGSRNQAIPQGFARLFAWLAANHLQPVGASFVIYSERPDQIAHDNSNHELCVPVIADLLREAEVEIKEIGDFQAATTIYRGETGIQPAYAELYDWLTVQGYRAAGAPLEVYLSVPGEELRAEVYVPIKKSRARAKTGTTKPKTTRRAKIETEKEHSIRD